MREPTRDTSRTAVLVPTVTYLYLDHQNTVFQGTFGARVLGAAERIFRAGGVFRAAVPVVCARLGQRQVGQDFSQPSQPPARQHPRLTALHIETQGTRRAYVGGVGVYGTTEASRPLWMGGRVMSGHSGTFDSYPLPSFLTEGQTAQTSPPLQSCAQPASSKRPRTVVGGCC